MKLHASLAAAALTLVACGGGGETTEAPKSEVQTKTATPTPAQNTRAEIRVVGSSTVYPFSIKVAQEFKNKTGINVVVESTGSGGGHKLFCEGVGVSTPDVTNSSRRQKKSEFDTCGENGVSDVVAVSYTHLTLPTICSV